MPRTTFVLLAVLVAGGVGGALLHAGVYNIGADAPRKRPVYWIISNMRDRSIAVRSHSIAVPCDLRAPQRIATGAGLYAEMCSGCPLAPSLEKTEISQGLYPEAPDLSNGLAHTPGEEFWMIKHGIKMTAMPAWGRTHSDELIWDMVAFVRTLPKLSPARYQAAVNPRSCPSREDIRRQVPDEGRDDLERGGHWPDWFILEIPCPEGRAGHVHSLGIAHVQDKPHGRAGQSVRGSQNAVDGLVVRPRSAPRQSQGHLLDAINSEGISQERSKTESPEIGPTPRHQALHST